MDENRATRLYEATAWPRTMTAIADDTILQAQERELAIAGGAVAEHVSECVASLQTLKDAIVCEPINEALEFGWLFAAPWHRVEHMD